MSASSPIKFSFYILISALILQNITATNPLVHKCSPTSQNFTANDSYERSLNTLLYTFQNLAPTTGFALGSLGQTNKDRTFGLALCRGDILGSNCTSCIAEARTEIQKLCPNNKAAAIWYDNCLVKYSDEEFFGQIDNQTKFHVINVQNVTGVVGFRNKTMELLSRLILNASSSARMYAAGDIEIEGSNKIYGLAQCSRDLVSDDCRKCLNGAIAELPSCCDEKEGGRVVFGASCTVRYETYPFVNSYH